MNKLLKNCVLLATFSILSSCAYDMREDWIPDISSGNGWSIDAAEFISYGGIFSDSFRIRSDWMKNSGVSESPLTFSIEVTSIGDLPPEITFDPASIKLSYAQQTFYPSSIKKECAPEEDIMSKGPISIGGGSKKKFACLLVSFNVTQLKDLSAISLGINEFELNGQKLEVPEIRYKQITRWLAACGSDAAKNAIFCMQGGR
jgi:hypothetical protein